MKRFPVGLPRILLLLSLQLNLRGCSSLLSVLERSEGTNPLAARSTREVQFAESKQARSSSIASDKTDIGDNGESGDLDRDDYYSNFFGWATPKKRDSGITFDAIVEGFSGGSCYGSGRVKGYSESEMNDSGLTSNISGGDSFDSEMVRSAPVLYGPFGGASLDRGEAGFSFGPQFVSETCSLVSDLEFLDVDCFDGEPVDRFPLSWVFDTLIPFFQSRMRLTKASANQILEYATIEFDKDATIVDLEIADGENLFVVGDIHGQFEDLIRIFEQNGWPTGDKKFIFNGDIVDRGHNSLECLLTLFVMKIVQPNNIFITRGNHESLTCGDGTFKMECLDKLDEQFFTKSHSVFEFLPLAYVINRKYFVCHGGLPNLFKVEDLRRAKKPNFTLLEYALVYALLWNDPHEGLGMIPSRRGGTTLAFGWDVTVAFLNRHRFDLLIRSHEYHQDGYAFCHNNKCLTVFSAPNYCGIGNKGAIVRIGSDLRLDIVPIVIPDSLYSMSLSSYLREEKERSLTMIAEEIEFVLGGYNPQEELPSSSEQGGEGKDHMITDSP